VCKIDYFCNLLLYIYFLNINVSHFYRGYISPDGKYIRKNIIQSLIKLDAENDFKLAHKLSDRHISVEGVARMNVKLAAHLFSNTVFKALLFCGNNNYINNYNWKEVSLVIENESSLINYE